MINRRWLEGTRETIRDMISEKIEDAFESALDNFNFGDYLSERIEDVLFNFDFDEAINTMIEEGIDIEEMVGEAVADLLDY